MLHYTVCGLVSSPKYFIPLTKFVCLSNIGCELSVNDANFTDTDIGPISAMLGLLYSRDIGPYH